MSFLHIMTGIRSFYENETILLFPRLYNNLKSMTIVTVMMVAMVVSLWNKNGECRIN